MDALKKKIDELRLGEEEHKPQVAAPVPPPAAPAHKESNIFDKISHALGDKPATPPPVPVAQPQQPHQKESFMDKVAGGIFGEGAHKQSPPPPTVAQPQQHQKTEPSNFFDKIGDHVNQAISGKKTPEPTPAPALVKDENLFDKLSHAISGKPEPQPQKPQTLSDKLSGKINDALGGGQKAEMKEDKLDKAIDLFQEHVLKEGPQNKESALEQAKDKQIADAIRKAVNRPRKDDDN